MSRVSDANWRAAAAFAADADRGKFTKALDIPPGGPGPWVSQLLMDALTSQDADLVEFGLICVLAFNVDVENADTITKLLVEEWHHSHENLVSSIQNSRWHHAVPALMHVIATPHAYLAYDNDTGLRIKIVHALNDIGTPEALFAIRQLEGHPDVEVAAVARHLLGRR